MVLSLVFAVLTAFIENRAHSERQMKQTTNGFQTVVFILFTDKKRASSVRG
jgi:hypothetical protein